MAPENLRFGGGVSETALHPVVLGAMLLAILLILVLPRRQVIVPFLLFTFLVPQGQQIYVGGVHWLVLRIVILAGCLRLLIDKFKTKGKLFPNGSNGIDRAFVVWALYAGLAPILLFQTSAVVPTQMAFWLQSFGGYLFLRYSIQDDEDITRATKTLALLTLVLGLCMANEHFYGVNIFGYTGSGPIIPFVRDNLIRAQACFAHPILAGCFGATLVPLFYWLGKGGRAKGLAATGMLGSTLMVLFSISSTPAMAWVGGIGALLLWPARRVMRGVRWGIALTLVGLHLVMKSPVWFLISRVNLTGSSDAWSRAMLIDTFFRHFKDWWLVGAETSGWGYDMWDLSNQFVAVGETGGLLAFICFIALISRSFGRLGKMRRQVAGDRNQEWLYWSLGAVMFAHIVAYFGVSYFDQTSIWWFAFLAMVSAATAGLRTVSVRAESPVESELPIAAWEEPAPAGLP
jgi:hypothetical protein